MIHVCRDMTGRAMFCGLVRAEVFGGIQPRADRLAAWPMERVCRGCLTSIMNRNPALIERAWGLSGEARPSAEPPVLPVGWAAAEREAEPEAAPRSARCPRAARVNGRAGPRR